MKKLLSLYAAIVVIGCGAETSVTAGGAPNDYDPAAGGGPVDSISLPVLAAGTEMVKVIVRKGAVMTLPVYDEEGIQIGEEERYVQTFGYVMNVDPDVATTVAVPHGTGYTLEIIAGGLAAGGSRPILEYYKSGFFDVPGDPAPALPAQAFAPSLVLPGVIYEDGALYGSPWDTYTVSVSGLGYPLSGSSWSLTADGAQPLSRSAAAATFAAPTTADVLDFVGTFLLDPSLMVAADAGTSWQYTKTGDQVTPVPSSVVSIVPQP